MPQLYFTDLGALHRPAIVDGVVDELSGEVIAAAKDFGLVDGMPFILGQDGSYDHHLNRFFRACPTMGLRSLNSLRAYAKRGGRLISTRAPRLIAMPHGWNV